MAEATFTLAKCPLNTTVQALLGVATLDVSFGQYAEITRIVCTCVKQRACIKVAPSSSYFAVYFLVCPENGQEQELIADPRCLEWQVIAFATEMESMVDLGVLISASTEDLPTLAPTPLPTTPCAMSAYSTSARKRTGLPMLFSKSSSLWTAPVNIPGQKYKTVCSISPLIGPCLYIVEEDVTNKYLVLCMACRSFMKTMSELIGSRCCSVADPAVKKIRALGNKPLSKILDP